MNNILVVNVNWLGDAIFSTPVFKALKTIYPHARVSCLCAPKVKEVLNYCPYVDEIIVYDERVRHAMPWDKGALIRQISQEKFDAAFILHRSMTRALLVFLAGIPTRIGYSKTPWLLTHPIPFAGEEIHRSDMYLRVLEGHHLKVDDRRCELRLKLEDMQSLDAKLAAAGISEAEDFIVLNPGGNWDLKRWPPDQWALLARQVAGRLKEKVVFSGGEGDRELCAQIARQAGCTGVLLAGKTSLGESLALYKRAQVVVSADSGPLHLANSVGAHVIGIFGPTRPEITGPRGLGGVQIVFKEIGCNNAPCYHLACPNNACMQAATVDDVFQVIKTVLD